MRPSLRILSAASSPASPIVRDLVSVSFKVRAEIEASTPSRVESNQRAIRTCSIGGGDGIRTHCLYIANVALYQLSYTPEETFSLTQGASTLWLAIPDGIRVRIVELSV